MSREAAINHYCRAVSKRLEAPRRRRTALLSGLRQELEERFSPLDGVTPEEICAEVGPPEETAGFLMESVPEEERGRYWLQQRRLSRLVIVGLVILLATIMLFFYYTEKTQVARTEETIIVNPTIFLENTSEKGD